MSRDRETPSALWAMCPLSRTAREVSFSSSMRYRERFIPSMGGEGWFTQNFPFLPVPAGSSAMERAGLMIHNMASVQSIVSPASFFTGRGRYRSNPVKGKKSPHPCETLHGVQHAGRKRNFDSVPVQYCSRDRHG